MRSSARRAHGLRPGAAAAADQPGAVGLADALGETGDGEETHRASVPGDPRKGLLRYTGARA